MGKDKILQGDEAERAKIDFGLQENLERGFVKITGYSPDGQPLYSLTEKGIKEAEKIMKEAGVDPSNKEQVADFLGLPS